ncbi:MAG: hypothetical protein ACOCXG_03455 [Nanoarchaeota archaeon]
MAINKNKNKNKKLKEKKAEISIQTIFYIMMAIIFVAIVMYGINKLFFVNEQLSETQRIEIKNDLEKAFQYCEDPLNAGSMKIIEIKNDRFNSVCVAGNGEIGDSETKNETLAEELSELTETGKNVFFMDVDFIESGNNFKITRYNIIDTLEVSADDSFCVFDEDRDGKITIEVEC